MRHRPWLEVPAALGLGAVLLVGCGSGGVSPDRGAGRVRVIASLYPLQWMAEQVGGDRVAVSNLTAPGVEPHDLTLSPKDVASLAAADVIVYLSGYQAAVDDAVAASDATTFDAADATELLRPGTGQAPGRPTTDARSGGVDPHFWLDPTKLAEVSRALAETLADRDPEHAASYRAAATRVAARLATLDGEFRRGLRRCTSRDLVTSHQAFGYLAARYGLDQVGIAGLSPAQEPSGADLARVTRFVERRHVRTIYFETLVSPDVAKTVAREAGVRSAVLDPIEGLTDASPGRDYLQVMRANLKTLQAGQPCP